MSRLPANKISLLALDEDLGAGNFLHQALASNPQKDSDYMFLQEPVMGFHGKPYKSFSLQSMADLAREWSAFYHSMGVEPKDVVGIFLDDTVDYFIQYVAITSIGAVPALINSKLSCDIAGRYLDRIEAKLVLATTERLEKIKEVFSIIGFKPKAYDIAEVLQDEPMSQLPEVFPYCHHAKDPVLLTHTSGTTGIPKAVIAAHQAYLHGVKFRLANPIPHIERYLSALPHSHNSGIAYLMEATIRGCPVQIQSDKSPASMAQSINEFQADFVVAFPKIFVEMVREEVDPSLLNSVFYWRSTGDAAHERHVKEITRWGSHEEDGVIKKGSTYIDGLGSSEMGSSLFTVFHDSKERNYDRCVGKPQGWVDAAVLDTYGNVLGANTVGRLGIKSPSLTPGYWNNTNITEKFTCQGYWITGDLVYRDTQGFFYHIDRITDAIQTTEGNIYSLLTEELIMKRFDSIFDCTVYQDNKQDGKVCASIRVDLVAKQHDEEQLKSMLQDINIWLKDNGKPQLHAISVTKPQTSYAPERITGKVLKRELRIDDEADLKVSHI